MKVQTTGYMVRPVTYERDRESGNPQSRAVETPYGTLIARATDDRHIFVGHPNGGMPLGDFRGVAYYVSAHVYRWSDGSWNIGEESAQPYERTRKLYIRRSGYPGTDRLPAVSTREAIVNVILAAAHAYLEATPGVLESASADSRRMERERLERELADLEKKATPIRARLLELRDATCGC